MSLTALRRRWWLVLLCTVAVAALAYGVGELRSRTATAEAVDMLNPGVNAPGPGAADQAARLAADYARVMPQDDELLRSVGASVLWALTGLLVACVAYSARGARALSSRPSG
jgi:hypothetical protein